MLAKYRGGFHLSIPGGYLNKFILIETAVRNSSFPSFLHLEYRGTENHSVSVRVCSRRSLCQGARSRERDSDKIEAARARARLFTTSRHVGARARDPDPRRERQPSTTTTTTTPACVRWADRRCERARDVRSRSVRQWDRRRDEPCRVAPRRVLPFSGRPVLRLDVGRRTARPGDRRRCRSRGSTTRRARVSRRSASPVRAGRGVCFAPSSARPDISTRPPRCQLASLRSSRSPRRSYCHARLSHGDVWDEKCTLCTRTRRC